MSLTAQNDARSGVNIKRRRYPDGEEGILLSLREICRLAREGSVTAVMRSFAGKILREAGYPKTVKGKLEAILDYVRTHVGYVPDPVGAESISAAVVTLCAPDQHGHVAICIPIGDCDDLTTCVLTLILAIGINAEVVRQFYGDGIQQHVFVEAQDERGNWLALDPSTTLPVGHKAKAKRETRMSPMDDKAIGLEGTDKAGAQYIGIGRPLEVWEQNTAAGGGWHVHDKNKGLGADPPSPVPYVEITDGTFHTGLRYRIGIQVSAQQSWQIDGQSLKSGFGDDFRIESLVPAGDIQQVPGDFPYFQSWVLQGVALRDGVFPETATRTFKYGVTGVAAVTLQIKRLVMGVQGTSTNPPGPKPPAPPPAPGQQPDDSTIGIVGAIGIAVSASVVGGLGFWGIQKWRAKRARDEALKNSGRLPSAGVSP